MPPAILLVKCGSTAADVRRAHGDYDRWFLRALAPIGVALRVIEAHAGAPLPARAAGWDGVVVTGSPRSVTERAPWMVAAAAWLRAEAERGVPVLGVCFGHQLLAEAYGGKVAPSPRGREIGTVRCALTAAGREDPLFAGVPGAFEAQATHEDEVVRLPRGAELLATNGWSRVQAFRVGPNVRAVQFHPEMDAAAVAATVAARADALVLAARSSVPATGRWRGLAAGARARGDDPEAALRAVRAGIRTTPAAERILANFVERFAARAGRPQGAGRHTSLREERLARRSERPTRPPASSPRA